MGIVDLVFVLDSSGSIRDNNPSDGSYDNYALVLQFVRRIVESLMIGENLSRVGMVIYSNTAFNYFYLRTYFDRNQMIQVILQARYIGGTTNTAQGIFYAREQQFTAGQGDRPNVPNVMIVITDGRSSVNTSETIPEAMRAHRDGIKVISIGVTNAVDLTELRGISSPPQEPDRNYFTSVDFTQLGRIVGQISSAICEVAPPSKYTLNQMSAEHF